MLQIRPACPRCGYDQSGAVASWERSDPPACPLTGVCSECGLGFLWRDVLNPVYAVQSRLYEHARNRLVASFGLTAWRALRPRAFWGWVRMEHPIRWRRLAAGAAGGVMLMHAAAIAATMGILTAGSAWSRFGPAGQSPPVRAYAGAVLRDPWRHLGWAAWPVGRRTGAAMSTSDLYSSFAAASLLIAVFMPLALLGFPNTLGRARVRRAHLARIAAYSTIGVPAVLAAPGVLRALILVGRATGFGEWGMDWMLRAERLLTGRGKLGVFVLVLVWMWAWWCAASRRYLRLPQPYIAATAAAAVAGSAALLVGLYVPGLAVAMWREW